MSIGYRVELPQTDHPVEGDQAPDFRRPLVNEEYWTDMSLSELTGEGLVLLVFYSTGGYATYVWKELQERSWESDHGVTIVGLSISTPHEQKSLIEEREMSYSQFSDPHNDVAEKYNIVHDIDGMTGITEPRPAVFLVNRDRRIEYSWVAQEWPSFPDYDEIEDMIDSSSGS